MTTDSIRNPDERPTLESINMAIHHLREQWSAAHSTFQRMDALANRTFQIWPDGINRPTYYPSTPSNIISHAVDRLLTFNPRFHRPPHSDSRQSMEWADEIESSIEAIWRDAVLKDISPANKLQGIYLAKYGYAVQREKWNLEARPVMPDRKDFDTTDEFDRATRLFKSQSDNFNPFQLVTPHPASVLLSMDKQPEEAIEFVTMEARHVKNLTERIKNPSPDVTRRDVKVFNSDDPYKKIKVAFYWTRHWAAAIATPPEDSRSENGETLYVLRNTWGLVPYSHAFSGFGSESYHNIGDPDAMAVGLLRDVEDSIIKQAQKVSAEHNIWIRDAFAPLVTSREPTDLIEALRRGIVQGDPSEFAYFPTILDKISSSVTNLGSFIDQDIEMGTFNKILSGFRDSGVSTVGQTAIFAQAADRRFDVLAQQMAHLATIASQHLLQLVDVTDTNVGVNGNHLRQRMIERDYALTASFESIDQAAQQAERQMSMAEFDRQLIDRATYLREARRSENIEDIKRGIDEDRGRADPFFAKALADLAMERIGSAEVQRRADELRAEFEGQRQAQGGRPPNPEGSAAGGFRPSQELQVDDFRQNLTDNVSNPARVNGVG